MPWRSVQNSMERGKLLEETFNEAAAAKPSIKLAVLRLTRTLGFGSTQPWHGFYGFKTQREQTFDGKIVQTAFVDPDHHIMFHGSKHGEGFALIPVSVTYHGDDGKLVTEAVTKNIEVLIDSEARGDDFWSILTPDVADEIHKQAAKRRKEWAKSSTPKAAPAPDVSLLDEDPAPTVAEIVSGKK